ncbi:HNH endonuclease [Allopusillimonas ginsengisoli]|uniref:HNH endonuclease n=1 Tax=Allopusillimonas ginsengisoli TaxID=453575 RepID=UPI0010221979|nr:HNH endonuclease signature motif containing protein [Allopusillimonas ginsengisoli]TEA70169.1 hypothetical protein ERE07_20980 [Allopusillimonas ginsengisoli]
MQLSKPSNLFLLEAGDTVTKRNLFDLIQFSKIDDSPYWEDESWQIGNTPQQGINWVGLLPECRAVLIKTRLGSYEDDGWANSDKSAYRYSFKARNGKVSHAEKANQALFNQPDYQYPIILFTEIDRSWAYEGVFSVSDIKDSYVVLERSPAAPQNPSDIQLAGQHTKASSEADASTAIDLLLSNNAISSSERIQLIKARIGQGLFRSRVAKIELCCRITSIRDKRFLIASHIKPWAKSDNIERLDGHNGLLLAPHIDRLFDNGYITFDDNGQMRVSQQLPMEIQQAWGLNMTVQPRPLIPRQQHYMAYHRDEVFQA